MNIEKIQINSDNNINDTNIIEKPPFNPEEALKKVRNISDIAEYSEMTPKERLLCRKEKLAEFKKELANFLMATGEINNGLEKKILGSSSVDREQLDEYLKEQSEKYNLDDVRLDLYRQFINKVEERGKLIDNYYKKYKGKEKEFSKLIFGKEPKDDVEIEKKSLCLELFYSDYDFENIFRKYYGVEDVDSLGGSVAGKTNISELNESIIILKSKDVQEKNVELDEIKEHEEKHVVDLLLDTSNKQTVKYVNTEVAALVEYLRKLTNKDNRKKSIEKFFNGFIRFACYRAKLEIFAFFKSNPMISPIFEGKFITQKEKNDGFYDFFRPDEIGFPMSLVSFFDKRLFNEIAKNKEEEYKKTIDEATNAMFQLEINGMSREKIIGVLQDEPLDRWNKIFERIKISDEYNKIKEKSN